MKLVLKILVIFIFISCNKKKEALNSNNSFHISGSINGNYSDYIYLNYGKTKDSVKVKNNKFIFKGSVKKPTQGYLILKDISYVSWLYVENSNIEIKTDFKEIFRNKKTINNLKIIEIKGSKSAKIQDDYRTFYQTNKNKENFKNLLYNKLKVFLNENAQHPISGSILGELALIKPILSKKQLEELFLEIDSTKQDKDDLEMFKMGIKNLDKYAIGKPFLNFKLPNTKEKEFSIKNNLGSIILIDFWASWCEPCRAKHPKLIKLKNQFKKQKFDIISVSIDENKDKWLEAIKKDNLVWTNLLDNKLEVKKELQIIGIPFNYLINEKGIIIGINLSIEELETKLNESF